MILLQENPSQNASLCLKDTHGPAGNSVLIRCQLIHVLTCYKHTNLTQEYGVFTEKIAVTWLVSEFHALN